MAIPVTNLSVHRICKRVIAAAGIVLLCMAIMKNGLFLFRYLLDVFDARYDWAHDQPPGRQFLHLSSMLKNVSAAGYYTDSYGADFWYTSPALVEYQRAQAALAPTLLDAENPLRHDWVIFVCSRTGCENDLMRRHGLDFTIRIDGRIVLAHRKKGGMK